MYYKFNMSNSLYLGETSLTRAPGSGQAVRILLEHGADVHAKNDHGELYTMIVCTIIFTYPSINIYICVYMITITDL